MGHLTQLPGGALFEADLGSGVALYDVTHLLPTAAGLRWPPRKGHVTEQYVHHSGRLGRPGFAGMRNSALYTIRHHGWPGFNYTTWICYEPVLDDAGHLVVFRGNPDSARLYHAGTGPNSRAVAHCLQGNTTKRPLSAFQARCLTQLLPWFLNRYYALTFGHCEAPADGHAKASCPGTHALAFIHGLRATLV